jgi:hypothetical protein
MRIVIAKTFLSVIMLAILSSCSTSYVTLEETRRLQEPPAKPYRKVLVIGVASPHSRRESFENIFVDSLQRHGVDAVASYKFIDDLHDAAPSQVQAIAQRAGADAVALTRVMSKSEHTSYKLSTGHAEYRTVSQTTTAHSSTTVSMSGAGIVAGEIDSEGAILQTSFFDVSSTKLMWTAINHAAGGSNDKMDVCWELSFLLAEALGNDQLIEITSADVKMPHR